jgi:cytochrome c oxidase assembly protein subunit 15
VPPTSVSQLPPDYKITYSQYREKKNQRFARYLRLVGLSETAEKILADKSVLEEADFNASKTLVEYINRLVGVAVGFMIFAVFLSSVKFRKTKQILTGLSLFTLILVGFQGWFGSFVVSTNLTPWVVTVHMVLALVIVALLIDLYQRSGELKDKEKIHSPAGFWWLLGCMAVLLVQVLFGTQVREAIDRVASTVPREGWLQSIHAEFLIHRSFSWIVVIVHAGLVLNLRKTTALKAFPVALILLILATVLTGIGMAYFAVPPFLQPLHLLLATGTFGMQFMLLLKLDRGGKIVLET